LKHGTDVELNCEKNTYTLAANLVALKIRNKKFMRNGTFQSIAGCRFTARKNKTRNHIV
jgi:hypothetical protein